MLLGPAVLLMAAASPDPRSVLAQGDLEAMLQARGLSCPGCSADDMVAKLQESDHLAAKLASEGSLSVVVRYCAA